MGQAKSRGTYEQRIAQSKERAEALKRELAKLAIEEDKAAKAKEETTKQLIEWHLEHPQRYSNNEAS